MSAPVIAISNLVRRYGHVDAVSGLSLNVQPGRCYGFFGRNGAGKTTTIKCLLNLLRQTSGTVRVFGLDPARDEVAVKSRLAYVPDAVAFYPWMTVRDTLDYFAAFRSRWNQDTELALLDRFQLDVRQKASHLSKGQRTQLALITAICPEPELLVLDEPTSGLDPISAGEFDALIETLQKTLGLTVFMVTHDLDSLHTVCDRVAAIADGKVVVAGPMSDILACEHPWVKAYFRGARTRVATHALN
jgi:ABC-type multidrug transport system ATPase subunit